MLCVAMTLSVLAVGSQSFSQSVCTNPPPPTPEVQFFVTFGYLFDNGNMSASEVN